MNMLNNERLARIAGVGFMQEVVKPGVLVYIRTHKVRDQLHALSHCGPCTLITSYSDACVTDELASLLPDNVLDWYSNNVMTDNPIVHDVPIGFVYNVEREKALQSVMQRGPQPRRNLMYTCFTRANGRVGMYEMFGGYDWNTVKGGTAFDSIVPEEFYTDILHHDYVLSPEGAGPDCHRHWEALILGSIPIVKRSRAVKLLEDQPALLVDDWDEVTEERLLAELPMLKQRTFNTDLVDVEYWRGVICR